MTAKTKRERIKEAQKFAHERVIDMIQFKTKGLYPTPEETLVIGRLLVEAKAAKENLKRIRRET